MKTILNYFRLNIRAILSAIFEKILKVIPLTLVVAFILTTPNWAFLKDVFPDIEAERNYSESIDLSAVANDYELVDLRTSNTKTYKKINNSYEMVVFGEDVHYQENGQYKEIDNSIDSLFI